MDELRPRLIGDLKQLGRGVLMGGADIIPGVSGGTVALILGIYQRLVTAISHFDLTLLGHLRSRQWAAAASHVDLRFLVTLGLGILSGIAGLASLMNYLLSDQVELTLSGFFGLILASSWIVARSIPRWTPTRGLLAGAGAIFAFWLVAQPFSDGHDGYGYILLCGMIAICAMILPGISGAFILLIMGMYEHITGVLRGLLHGELTADNLLTVAVFALGCSLGLLGFSKFLRWLLARYQAPTMAVLCGFMLGSLRKIWPFKAGESVDLTHDELHNAWPKAFDGHLLLAIGIALGGIALVLTLDWVTRRDQQP